MNGSGMGDSVTALSKAFLAGKPSNESELFIP